MSFLCSISSSKLAVLKIFKECFNFVSKSTKIIYEYLILKILFHLILNLILSSVIVAKQIQIFLCQKLKEAEKIFNKKRDLDNNSDTQELYSRTLTTSTIPNHVCFIINEKLNEEKFKSLSIRLTSKFTSLGVKLITFYTHEGK